MEKKHHPFFSVIILAWIVKDYIIDCLSSVKNQKYTDFEAIVVIPHGNDQTEKLCESFIASDKRFKLLKTQNNGQLMNRMAGFRSSIGEYVIFLDGDDLWKPDLLHEVRKVCVPNQDDIVLWNFERFTACGEAKINAPVFSNGAVFCNAEKKTVYHDLILGRLNAMWDKAIRRDIFEKLSTDFSEYSSLRMFEDLLFNAYVFDKCDRIVYISTPLYRYRMHNGSIMHTFQENEIINYYVVKTCINRFRTQWNIDDAQIKNQFYDQIAHYTADWIYRCAISDFDLCTKHRLFEWVRNDAALFPEIKSRLKNQPLKFRHKMFVYLFNINDGLLLLYAYPFHLINRIKKRQLSIYRINI